MSMSLSQEVVQKALNEHNFHGEYCSDCGITQSKVLFLWRRGMADTTRCSKPLQRSEETQEVE